MERRKKKEVLDKKARDKKEVLDKAAKLEPREVLKAAVNQALDERSQQRPKPKAKPSFASQVTLAAAAEVGAASGSKKLPQARSIPQLARPELPRAA